MLSHSVVLISLLCLGLMPAVLCDDIPPLSNLTSPENATREVNESAPPNLKESFLKLGQASEALTCLGDPNKPGTRICCRNCSDCCSEHMDCNFGNGNRGVGNIGDLNYGDFNMASFSTGDCNMADKSWGIGGPEHKGCPEDLHIHIINYCAVNPHYRKCGFPPHYFGDQLSDILRDTVSACDASIPVSEKSEVRAAERRRARQKQVLQRIKVAKASSTGS